MMRAYSSKGLKKGRQSRLRGLAGVLLAMVIVLSACSGADNNAGSRSTEGASNAASAEKGNSGNAPREALGESDRSSTSSEPKKEIVERNGVYSNPKQKIQAGQLTAGEWDDLAAWEGFNNLLNSQEGDSSKRFWGFWQFHRLEVIVSANGRAVSDAEVVLQADNQAVWQARTNTDGIAYVYAGLYEQRALKTSNAYNVQVSFGQEQKTTQGLDITRQGSVKVDLGSGVPGTEPSEKVDLMFVVDTTGSMKDELDYLEAELKDVVERVADEHANQLGIRVSANFYRDAGDEYITRPYPFTTNINEVIDQFSEQNARGGGDYPEAVDQALRDGIHKHDWSEEARARLLFLVLDAPPHEDAQVIEEVHRLIEDASEKGIRIIPVASSGVNADTEYLLRFMAVATGGTYLFLTDDSGIGGDHLEPAVGEYEVKLLNDLLVEVINRYVS
jgi:hypothetical protein